MFNVAAPPAYTEASSGNYNAGFSAAPTQGEQMGAPPPGYPGQYGTSGVQSAYPQQGQPQAYPQGYNTQYGAPGAQYNYQQTVVVGVNV